MIVFNDESRQKNYLFQYKHNKSFNEIIVQRFQSLNFKQTQYIPQLDYWWIIPGNFAFQTKKLHS